MYWNLIMWLLLYSNPGPFCCVTSVHLRSKKKYPQKIIEKEASSLVISSKPPNLEVKTKVTAPAVAPRGGDCNWTEKPSAENTARTAGQELNRSSDVTTVTEVCFLIKSLLLRCHSYFVWTKVIIETTAKPMPKRGIDAVINQKYALKLHMGKIWTNQKDNLLNRINRSTELRIPS